MKNLSSANEFADLIVELHMKLPNSDADCSDKYIYRSSSDSIRHWETWFYYAHHWSLLIMVRSNYFQRIRLRLGDEAFEVTMRGPIGRETWRWGGAHLTEKALIEMRLRFAEYWPED